MLSLPKKDAWLSSSLIFYEPYYIEIDLYSLFLLPSQRKYLEVLSHHLQWPWTSTLIGPY
jgi:hypothetical protein